MSRQTTFVDAPVQALGGGRPGRGRAGDPVPGGGAIARADGRGASVAKAWIWTGRVVRALLLAFLALDGTVKVLQLGPAMEGTVRVGYPASAVLGIGIAELACVVAYAVPRTAVLGAILLTGYLGGATATHVRIGEPFVLPVLFGVLVWAALLPSDARLRALLPLRR